MSTITINTQSLFGTAFPQCVVEFTPLSTPYIAGEVLVLSGPRQFTLASNGTGVIDLLAGSYTVVFKGIPLNEDSFTVGIPNDDATYTFVERINAGAAVLTPIASMGSTNGAAFGITDLVGGGATKLDGYVTVGKGSLLFFVNSVVYSFGLWEKIAGTSAEDVGNGIIRPDDYNASTNAFIWVRRQ